MMQVDRDRLDRAAEALGMTRREPGEKPALPPGARVWTMDERGVASSTWTWADAAPWHLSYAWRAEDQLGNAIDDIFDDDGDVEWDVGEPAPVIGNG